jgi:hypothetical protein
MTAPAQLRSSVRSSVTFACACLLGVLTVVYVPMGRRHCFLLSITGPSPLATADLSIAIFYNIANSSIDAARGKHDIVGGMAAGAVSGAVFKASGKSPTYGHFRG